MGEIRAKSCDCYMIAYFMSGKNMQQSVIGQLRSTLIPMHLIFEHRILFSRLLSRALCSLMQKLSATPSCLCTISLI